MKGGKISIEFFGQKFQFLSFQSIDKIEKVNTFNAVTMSDLHFRN